MGTAVKKTISLPPKLAKEVEDIFLVSEIRPCTIYSAHQHYPVTEPVDASPVLWQRSCLIAAAWGFQADMPMLGCIIGWSLVAAALVNVSTGFYIPSFIVRVFFGKVACGQLTNS